MLCVLPYTIDRVGVCVNSHSIGVYEYESDQFGTNNGGKCVKIGKIGYMGEWQ